MHYKPPCPPCTELRLEAVTVSVGFDDLLDETIGLNHPHLDSLIVVTAHDDHKTQKVAEKHGCFCVPTDLFNKNGRHFNKGAAINAGFGYFQWNGWRCHIDADIILPDNFRRILFNHTHLEEDCLYGADRVDIHSKGQLDPYVAEVRHSPQHRHSFLIQPPPAQIGSRLVSLIWGYIPIGYFQLWHASHQHAYPYSIGNAAHDDVLFGMLWPEAKRHLLPTIIVRHLSEGRGTWGENWESRASPRFIK
jgi:hypothetical protein